LVPSVSNFGRGGGGGRGCGGPLWGNYGYPGFDVYPCEIDREICKKEYCKKFSQDPICDL
jgi:hypothetical protein